MPQELIKALFETLLMVFISGIITLLIGLPLGLLLGLTRAKQLFAKPKLNKTLSSVLHFAQSLPYVVLMIALMPITSFLMNNENGWWVAVLPLSLAAIPYFACQAADIFSTVPKNLLEVVSFFGAKPLRLILKALLPETGPRLIQVFTKSLAQLVSYSAIAGLLGANGLGNLAIQRGYPNFRVEYIIATAILLILLIQGLQWIGHYFAKKRVA